MTAARFRSGACVVLALVAVLAGSMQQAGAVSTSLVISQVYGGGGNTGAPLKNDFIEVFNRSGSTVDLSGWSVQYASTTGTSWQKTDLSGTLQAGQYLLVQESGGTNGITPPAADVTGTIPMSAGAGKVVLRNTNTLIVSGTSCPTDSVDVVGYGSGTNCTEGGLPTATLSNTTAAVRANSGCTDTDNNAADFSTGVPGPRNRASALVACDGTPTPTSPTVNVTTAPPDPTPGSKLTITAAVTPGTNPASTGLSVNCDLSWAGLGSSSPLFDDGTNGDTTAGDLIFSRLFTIPPATVPGSRIGSCTVSDSEGRSGSGSYTVNVVPGVADIAPTVSSHTPDSDETGVPVDANIGISFSEPVSVTGSWYSISCGTSGMHTAAVSSGASGFLLNPDADFANAETCTVTLDGTLISDQDTIDPPDTVAGNPSWSFTTAGAPTPGLVVISQVYGGGGNSGAVYQNDFIELFNRGATPASLNGWSVQYASAAGTGAWLKTNLTNVTLAPGQYYLVQQAAGTNLAPPLPTPDVIGTTNMSGTAGKVALVNNTTILSGICPTGAIDLVGYGAANCSEGSSPTAALTNATAALRKGGGCIDTDNNAADFATGTPTPRNTAAATHVCGGDEAPFISARSPGSGASGVAADANVTVTFSEAVDVAAGWYTISCVTSGAHAAAVSGGATSFTLDPDTDFAAGESCTVTIVAAHVTDQDTDDPPDNMAADDSWSFTIATPPVAIHDIQGASHISPMAGSVSNVPGIVTAKRSNGFYMQDPNPDSSDATSEGIFVFTSSPPTVQVGDAVRVSGNVQEFRPGGPTGTNLTTTEISSPTTTVLSSGNPLPAAIVAGTGGRVPPAEIIEDDASGDVETSGVFDPAADGLDFWESLEGMRVQLDNAVAVGPTNSFGETPVVGDDGANASLRTARGGLVIRPGDFNPERLVLDDTITAGLPAVNVGDHYNGSVVGVLDYNFGLFMLEVTAMPTVVHDGVTPESTTAPAASEVTLATFNFENLDPTDPPAKFARLGGILVNNLKSPDIVSGEEVQDNTGPTDNGVVDANVTLDTLVSAIQAAGGPTYAYRYINPVNDQDGGEPGGNIRQVFLFRTDRVSFVDRPGGGSTTATTVVNTADGPELSASPGRIDPTNAAFTTSRKPLVGEFMFAGQHLFVIANHFNSKGGDQPLMGHFQPPTRSSEVQRHNQAQVVHDFVASILGADANAKVVVAGDLNDFEFSDTVTILKAGVLHDLMDTLPPNERYSYVFEGNSQTLDHILLSAGLFSQPFAYDVVHVNSEFADQASDHEPSVVRIGLNAPPSASAGGPYTVDEGGSVTVSGAGTDPEGGPLTYAWDLDDNGTFETAGQSPTFSAAALDGPGTRTVTVRVTDDAGATATDSTQVTIANVPPTATFSAPASTFAGSPFTLSLTNPSDPSAADTAAGFEYAFDCGSGYGPFGSSATVSCPTGDTGTRSVGAQIRDKDGGVTDYRGAVNVVVTYASLCDLVQRVVTSTEVATGLCDKLNAASAAAARGNTSAEQNQLAAFRSQVDAQTGKSISASDAELLKLLSTRL